MNHRFWGHLRQPAPGESSPGYMVWLGWRAFATSQWAWHLVLRFFVRKHLHQIAHRIYIFFYIHLDMFHHFTTFWQFPHLHNLHHCLFSAATQKPTARTSMAHTQGNKATTNLCRICIPKMFRKNLWLWFFWNLEFFGPLNDSRSDTQKMRRIFAEDLWIHPNSFSGLVEHTPLGELEPRHGFGQVSGFFWEGQGWWLRDKNGMHKIISLNIVRLLVMQHFRSLSRHWPVSGFYHIGYRFQWWS